VLASRRCACYLCAHVCGIPRVACLNYDQSAEVTYLALIQVPYPAPIG